jgi:hypothetical protein
MDPDYERPILARYLDPYELVWLATARRFGLHIRRDPSIFSRTDGTGLLALGPRDSLDADDTLAQQMLHEVCHWVVNGRETFGQQDWGYELDVPLQDPREHACLRLQAWWTERYGLRGMMGPTGIYRQYWERLGDPLTPLDASAHEAEVIALTRVAIARAQGEPWAGPMDHALSATAALKKVVAGFLPDYATEVEADDLPSLWAR